MTKQTFLLLFHIILRRKKKDVLYSITLFIMYSDDVDWRRQEIEDVLYREEDSESEEE